MRDRKKSERDKQYDNDERERECKKEYESEYSYHGKFQLPKRRRTLTSDVLYQEVAILSTRAPK
jgi:hypothetical protein